VRVCACVCVCVCVRCRSSCQLWGQATRAL
jgi:hypothetical protein